VGRNHV